MQEKIPVEEVFEKLKCTKEGLNTTEGEERRDIFSPNKLEEKKRLQSSSSWVSCGILYHGSWRQLPLWSMEEASQQIGKILLALLYCSSSTPPSASLKKTMLVTLPLL